MKNKINEKKQNNKKVSNVNNIKKNTKKKSKENDKKKNIEIKNKEKNEREKIQNQNIHKNNYKFLYIIQTFLIIVLLIILTFFIYKYETKKCITVKKVKEIKKIVNDNYVFLGDSITDFYDVRSAFSDYNVVNSGINGNRTNDIINDMYNRVYRYNPSKVIILIGINNLLYDTDDTEKVVDDIEKISKEIGKKSPNCKIYIESIYPVNDDWRIKYNNDVPKIDELKTKIIHTNDKIKELCEEKNYNYVDIYSSLIDENNELDKKYTDDGLHPNTEGYEIITEKIEEKIIENRKNN